MSVLGPYNRNNLSLASGAHASVRYKTYKLYLAKYFQFNYAVVSVCELRKWVMQPVSESVTLRTQI